MIVHAIFYGIALASSCAIVSGEIIRPPAWEVQGEEIRQSITFPPRNDFKYATPKKRPQYIRKSPSPIEKRENKSFIRFGRSLYEGNLENADYTSGNEILDSGGLASSASNSRVARGRSDVIIRFGRNNLKNLRGTQNRLSSADTMQFLKYRSDETPRALRGNDLEELLIDCSKVLVTIDANGNDLRPLYNSKLVRLCNSLGLGIDENDETRRKSQIIEILDDASQTESIK